MLTVTPTEEREMTGTRPRNKINNNTDEGNGNRGCVFFEEKLEKKGHKVKEKVVPFGGKKGTSDKKGNK